MKIYFGFLIFLLIAGCTLQPNNSKTESYYKKPLPPPLSPEDQKKCDSLRTLAYSDLSKGKLTIAYNDTIKSVVRYKLFLSAIEQQFKFKYFRLDNLNNILTVPHKLCIQPIMDSAIRAIYGSNAKDSIVNAAYGMANEMYTNR